MRTLRNHWALLGALAAAGSLAAWGIRPADAADHLDPPGRTDPAAGAMADRPADIADVFAWHSGTGAEAKAVVVLTYSGPNDPVAGQRVPCDRDVLYTIHISNDDDATDAEFDIQARFGKLPDDADQCYVRFTGIPGAGMAPLEGAAGHRLARGGVSAQSGLFDDHFFFDLVGFRETLSTGTLSFVNDRDFFAGKNTPALVVEMPLAAVSPTGQAFRVWATTARIGGGT